MNDLKISVSGRRPGNAVDVTFEAGFTKTSFKISCSDYEEVRLGGQHGILRLLFGNNNQVGFDMVRKAIINNEPVYLNGVLADRDAVGGTAKIFQFPRQKTPSKMPSKTPSP